METKLLNNLKLIFLEVTNYYPEILTDEVLVLLLHFMKNLMQRLELLEIDVQQTIFF
jgi:hypothetical protein